MPHSDLDWVRRAIHGDALGRHEFVVRLERVPATLARRNARLGRPLDRGDLDDLFQEIASLVWAKLGEYSGLGSFDGWVFRFCDLGFRNSARRRKKRPAPLTDSDVTSRREAPQRDVLLLDVVARRLSDLGALASEVIRLKHFEDRTFVEIGVQLGLSANSAKTSYYRGLDRLRRALGPTARAAGEPRPLPLDAARERASLASRRHPRG